MRKDSKSTPIDWSQYSLAQLRQHAVQSFREGGGSRPDVLLIEIDKQFAVLKDQQRADYLFALLIGPLLNWRECKALKRLESIPQVPNLLFKPTSRSFLMSYLPSEPVTRLQTIEADWPDFFTRLQNVITEIHSTGVAHNDLRNPTNILISSDGEPVLVDLVAAFCQGQSWNVLNQWIFTKFCQVDLSAITKLKTRIAPDLINENDVHAEQIAGRPGLFIRAIGQWVRRISRLLFTSK